MSNNSADYDFLAGVRVVDFDPVRSRAVPAPKPSPGWAPRWSKSKTPEGSIREGGCGRANPMTIRIHFQQFNANKKSITLNLKSPEGLAIVKDLLRKADITVENMAPGTIERLGLGYEDVKKLNPGIIFCQVKGFGEGSPYEKNLAFDMIAQATGGTISVTGEKGRQPVKPGLSLEIPAPE